MTTQVRRPELPSASALLAGATERAPMRPADGLSDVPMERLVLDGQRCVLKWLSPRIDWVMRLSQDELCRPVVAWQEGLYEAVSPWVDPLVLAVARDEERDAWALLMRDASDDFLPAGDAPIPAQTQAGILRDMAGMHAAFWGFEHRPGLCAPEQFYGVFSEGAIAQEASRGPLQGVPSFVASGRERLHAAQPVLAEQLLALAEDPLPLVRAVAQTPQTLVHHDWKGGNLGVRADGRTLLVDWAFPGSDGGCADLAWYLAVNCDRLTTSKEQVIADYRAALERQGIGIDGWFDRQLELALLGALVVLGWSKTEDPRELGWWVERTEQVASELLR